MKLRGSITVFISIVLSVLIAFSGVIVDISRFWAGEKHARAAVQLSVQSALTRYYAPLKDHYGLWANGEDNEELEAMVQDLIEKNLGVENRFMPSIVDLYGFTVDNVSVQQVFSLADEEILEKQITEYMKYRAPVITAGNFLGKLKALKTFLAQSGVLNKRMELENKIQKVREEQVYLSMLLSERIPGYRNNNKPMGEIDENLGSMKVLLNEIKKLEQQNRELDAAWLYMPALIEKISEARTKIKEIEVEISNLENDLSVLHSEYTDIETDIYKYMSEIEELEGKIDDLESKISEEQNKENPNEGVIRAYESEIRSLESSLRAKEIKISSLRKELNQLDEEIENTKNKIFQKEAEIKNLRNSVRNEEEQLNSEVNICLKILDDIKQKLETISAKSEQIEITVNKFIKYHEKSIELINGILKQSDEISQMTEEIDSEIKKQSEESDNAFLVKMKADMKKLVLTTQPEILNSIKSNLENNLAVLEEASVTIKASKNKFAEILRDLQSFIKKTEEILDSLIYFERETFNVRIEQPVNNIIEKINSSVPVYKLPSYNLEPAVNKKEKNEFYRWCNRVFDENNDVDNKDKGYEKKLRDNIKKADDAGTKESERSFNGKDTELSDEKLNELFESLPSNSKNEEDILLSDEETAGEPEEKYRYSLNQNGNIASRIDELLSNAGDYLLKSLYINEYIIGAFNNANIDNVKTQRISLHGKPAKTFYEKAEVEYIIFGAKKEKVNAKLAQLSIFGIRLGLNLIHVYKCPEKIAAATSAAVTISGWTGFGVPIVRNLILYGWAAGESYLDLKDINAGKDVPVYKTDNTWKLSLKSLFSEIAENIVDDTSKQLKETTDKLVDKADDALQALVRETVASAVHDAFLPLEQAITEMESETDADTEVSIELNLQIVNEMKNIEDLKKWVQEICEKQYHNMKSKVSDWTKSELENYKNELTDRILDYLFKSQAYTNLVSGIKKNLNNIIDQGSNQISEYLKQVGNQVGDQGVQEQLTGTVVSFDYTDYLRLLLTVVPNKTKLLRAADLIQINLQETLDNKDFMMSEYNSFIIVEAEISMQCMFIPSFLRKEELGKFKIRWGYGY